MMTTSACATTQQAEAAPLPATVVVAFDRDSIRPLIVEGIADRSNNRAVQANDPVRIASISKLVMALATLRLVGEGKVDLYADVSQYTGWQVRHPGFPDSEVTLAQLLMHRSGLRDDAGYVIPLGESLQEKLADPAAWYADAPPGDAPFEYANLGSPVIATILEAATGERYDRLVQRTVFAPLGVKACLNWIGCGEDMVTRAVTLYRSTGEVARDDASDLPPNCTIPVAGAGDACDLSTYVPGTNASIFSPQGGVRIGMMDLARIGQALMGGGDDRFLSNQVTAVLRMSFLLERPDDAFFCNYGLGVQMLDPRGEACDNDLFGKNERAVGHAGEAYGLRSGLWFRMDDERGIAYFTSAIPDRTAPDEGGFAPEEIALVRRAMAIAEKSDGE